MIFLLCIIGHLKWCAHRQMRRLDVMGLLTDLHTFGNLTLFLHHWSFQDQRCTKMTSAVWFVQLQCFWSIAGGLALLCLWAGGMDMDAMHLHTQSILDTSLWIRSYITDRLGSNLETSLHSYVTGCFGIETVPQQPWPVQFNLYSAFSWQPCFIWLPEWTTWTGRDLRTQANFKTLLHSYVGHWSLQDQTITVNKFI